MEKSLELWKRLQNSLRDNEMTKLEWKEEARNGLQVIFCFWGKGQVKLTCLEGDWERRKK